MAMIATLAPARAFVGWPSVETEDRTGCQYNGLALQTVGYLVRGVSDSSCVVEYNGNSIGEIR